MIDGNRKMKVQAYIHIARFYADIYISTSFLFRFSSFFTFLHPLRPYPVLRFSFLLIFSSLSFLYFNILLLLIRCACLLHLFYQFGLYMCSSLHSLMNLRQGPPLSTSTPSEREKERERERENRKTQKWPCCAIFN